MTRSRSGCDGEQDVSFEGPTRLSEELNLLVAWGDPNFSDRKGLFYHGLHNRRSMPFALVPLPEASDGGNADASVKKMSITLPEHTVSSAGGSYSYTMHKLPLADSDETPYHMVQYRTGNDNTSPAKIKSLQQCSGGSI